MDLWDCLDVDGGGNQKLNVGRDPTWVTQYQLTPCFPPTVVCVRLVDRRTKCSAYGDTLQNIRPQNIDELRVYIGLSVYCDTTRASRFLAPMNQASACMWAVSVHLSIRLSDSLADWSRITCHRTPNWLWIRISTRGKQAISRKVTGANWYRTGLSWTVDRRYVASKNFGPPPICNSTIWSSCVNVRLFAPLLPQTQQLQVKVGEKVVLVNSSRNFLQAAVDFSDYYSPLNADRDMYVIWSVHHSSDNCRLITRPALCVLLGRISFKQPEVPSFQIG